MRLGQLDDKATTKETPSDKSATKEEVEALKSIMHDLRRTLLTADTIMRKLEGIIEKY
jgi:hypothetical protein